MIYGSGARLVVGAAGALAGAGSAVAGAGGRAARAGERQFSKRGWKRSVKAIRAVSGAGASHC